MGWTLTGQLPAGAPGPAGDAATVAVGDVTTLGTGEPATVENDGTPSAALLAFGLPRGSTGPLGPSGPLGAYLNVRQGSGTLVLDPTYATDYAVIVTGDFAVDTANLSKGQALSLVLVQDGTGSHSVTFPSDWFGYGDFALSTIANHFDQVVIWQSFFGTHVAHVATGTKPAGYWSPDDLPSKIEWFDADGITGTEIDDPITAWPNLAGGTGLTIVGAPVLRRNSAFNRKFVEFVGASADRDNGSGGSQPWTYAMVARVPVNGPVVSGASGSPYEISTISDDWVHNAGAAQGTETRTGTFQTVIGSIGLTAQDYIRVDGVGGLANASNVRTARYTRLFRDIGGTYGEGDLAVFIKTSALLTLGGSDMTALETYLNTIRDQLNA